MVWERGWAVVWVDSVIVAQKPRLSGYLNDIKQNMNNMLVKYSYSKEETVFNVKVKSAESVGALGREEAIAVWCSSLLKKR